MHNYWLWYYLGSVNVISGLLFAYDKNAANNNRQRIPERTLHLLEILGGVFANLLLMYTLRHKNRKFSYWAWTWVVILGWIFGIYMLFYKII